MHRLAYFLKDWLITPGFYSLTPPSVRPDISHLDEYMNSNMAGTATSTDAAENTPHWVVNWSRSFWKPSGHVNIFVF